MTGCHRSGSVLDIMEPRHVHDMQIRTRNRSGKQTDVTETSGQSGPGQSELGKHDLAAAHRGL